MNDIPTMDARNAISGALATCYVTIENNRYLFAQAINLEAKFEKNKVEVPIMGRTAKGNKAAGGKGSGSATFHFNTSILRRLMIRYMKTGEDFYFDMQVSNEDPTSTVGRQDIILRDCNIDSAILAKMDADADYLEDEFDFTFEDADMPTEFTRQEGML